VQAVEDTPPPLKRGKAASPCSGQGAAIETRIGGRVVEDLGSPISYVAVSAGVPVYDRDAARIGVVEHVIADEDADILHGLLVRTPSLSERHLFAHRDQVGEMHERGVVLSVRGAELHEPSEDAPAREVADSPLPAELRAAWEWLRRPR
jgi:hypothetical protein